MKFTKTDYKKMNRQPKAYRADGGSSSWRKASDICSKDEATAIQQINAELDQTEIAEVKRLLKSN
jgi:hypothetical protein